MRRVGAAIHGLRREMAATPFGLGWPLPMAAAGSPFQPGHYWVMASDGAGGGRPGPIKAAAGSGGRTAWKESMNLGLPEVDQKHQRIFELFEELRGIAAEGKMGKITQEMVQNIVKTVEAHFNEEAALLKKAEGLSENWKDMHLSNHLLFLSNLRIHLGMFTGTQSNDYLQRIDKLIQWFSGHIFGMDKQLVEITIKNRALLRK